MSLDQEKIKFAILYFLYNIEKIFSLLSVLTRVSFQLFWMTLGSARGLASSDLGMSRSSKRPWPAWWGCLGWGASLSRYGCFLASTYLPAFKFQVSIAVQKTKMEDNSMDIPAHLVQHVTQSVTGGEWVTKAVIELTVVPRQQQQPPPPAWAGRWWVWWRGLWCTATTTGGRELWSWLL